MVSKCSSLKYTGKLLSVLSSRYKMSAASETAEFATTLAGFGYAFNDEGKLRQINEKTGLPGNESYQFEVSKNATTNQRRYEALGDVITDHVYDLLIANGLQKIHFPSDVPEEQATFVFSNKSDLTNTKKLMIIIHGSGVVRAGQWSRSLIINQSLNHGTQIPYIKRARELGYDVLITNTNDNYRTKDGKRTAIPGNYSPTSHANSVWERLITPATQLESIAIVAHSYGGVATLDLAKKYKERFQRDVFAVGFTDSVHSFGGQSKDLLETLRSNGRNWVTSAKPVDTLVQDDSNDIPRFSAGHIKHEWTSWACMDALFEFVEDKYTKHLENKAAKRPKTDL